MKLRSLLPAVLVTGLVALTAFADGPSMKTADPACPAGGCCLFTPASADATGNSQAAVCPVSGEKLGEMGKPVEYVHQEAGKPDRVVTFCCKHCIADFKKEPAKYLAKLDAEAAAKKTAK